MNMEMIYVDHAATSPMHADVVEEMLPYFQENFGNPSSLHHMGRKARQAIDESRSKISEMLSVENERSLVFTSGGTEAINMAIIGYAKANQDKGKHIITSQIEHQAVLNSCKELEKDGFEVTYLPVDETGKVS